MKRFFLLAAAVLVASCASQGPRRADMPLISEAESRIAQNDFAGASQVYQRLIEESSSPDYYRLLAADTELRAGNGRAAQALLGAINADELATPDWYRFILLRSRIDLNRGNAREALSRLDNLNYQRLEPEQAIQYHTLRASALNQLGNMLESARERVALGELSTSPAAIEANNDAIYDALNRLPDRALAELQPPPPSVLGGWMNLTQILRAPAAQRESAIRNWQSRNLGHPADGPFLDKFLPKTNKARKVEQPVERLEPAEAVSEPLPSETGSANTNGMTKSNTVGVLVPLSGTYGKAGQAIRAGLEAARAADTDPAKPELTIIDTNGADVGALYSQLVQKGVRQVVGPLTKDDLAAVSKTVNADVPVLALNQNPDVNHESIFQFGLTPEQDVEQSAGSAWFDGKQSALVLAPASAFGQRMINHFSEYWRSLGGRVITVKTYAAGGNDFSRPVKEAVESAMAAGNTADFVFLVADPRDGSLLKPYLEAQPNYRGIPIYATSLIFNGQAGVPQNPDLSGIIFCDIPWLLQSGEGGPLSSEALRATVEQIPDSYRRLVAMGLDAYRLLPELAQLKSSSQHRVNGSTGVLTIEAGNRVQRQLQCAQFESGGIQPRGIAPLLKPGAPDNATYDQSDGGVR
jgi:outer membrane PBP1 activator LpoA protein